MMRWQQLVAPPFVLVLGAVVHACGSTSPTIESPVRNAPTSTVTSATNDPVPACGVERTPSTGPHAQPTVVWRAQTAGRIVASAIEVIGDRQIVVGSLDGWLYRFTADGQLVSSVDTGAPIRSQALEIADNDVVIANEAGTVMRIAANGSLVWRTQLAGPITTDPLIGCDGVIHVAADGIYALDLDGNIHWHHVEATTVYEQPFVDPEGLISFGTVDGRVVTLDSHGKVQATRRKVPEEPVPARAPVTDAAGVTYVVTSDQTLRATRGDGTELWSYSLGANVAGHVLLTSSGTLLIGTDDGHLYALH